MKIAEKIQESLNSITNWGESPLLAMTFNKFSESMLDTQIVADADAERWWAVAYDARLAELIGYSSPTIQECIKRLLDNTPMFSSAPIPKNEYIEGTDYFAPDYGVITHGYRWAKELNYATSRWDAQAAYSKLKNIISGETYPFYACNPDTGDIYRVFPTGRWHEPTAILNVLLNFADVGIDDAFWGAIWLWNSKLNEIYWDGTHYIYSPSLPNWELAAPTVYLYVTKLYISTGRILGEYYRILKDAEARYLADGWGSPQWGGYHVVVHHNPSNMQRSLDYLFTAMGTLHMLYPMMSETAKTNFRKMLTGEFAPKMAEGLLSSDVYSAPRFKIRNTLDPSDGATAYGAATLFLQAIIPDTGALAIPVYMEGAGQQEPTFFDPHHFGFDYNKKTIKIPVKAGKLKFQFGDAAPVERSFSFDGIYTVTFSSDWNRIIDARLTGPLDRVYLQIPTPWLTTATTAAQLFVAIATLGPFLAVTAKRIKQYLVPGGG